ncbi:MAG: NUDIX domain-containing protein [Desulfuromonadaceae bacterium]|nr:NUDIX domain-containing protein [Desulfuromonadaceae bacterium]
MTVEINETKTHQVEIVEREPVYRSFLTIERIRLRHSLFQGGLSPVITRELMERGQAVVVLLHDPQRDCVVLVEQFRIGALADEDGAWLLELVAGMIEEGESPHEVARRESREEAGREPHTLEYVGRYYPSPGGCSELIYLFYGEIDSRQLDETLAGATHEQEDIRVRVVPWPEVEQLLDSGRILNGSTLIGLQWLQLRKLRHEK